MRKYILIAAITTATLALIRAQTPEQITLRERAEASPSGRYVTLLPLSSSPTFPDIETVTHLSTLVITGTAISNQTKLSADGTFINTTYNVKINAVHKKTFGHFEVNSIVSVNLPGGRYEFKMPDDGIASAEVKSPWFKKMDDGKQYILFLNLPDNNDLTGGNISGSDVGSIPVTIPLKPTGGPQGVFEVAAGVVKSNSGRLRDPVWQYHNLPLNNFLTLIQNAVVDENPIRPF